MIKTILELDLVGYSTISTMIEQGTHVESVTELNRQIQQFIEEGRSFARADGCDIAVVTTGDGAIVVLDSPADAHRFAQTVNEATRKHNQDRSEPIGKRVFRGGIATGALDMQARSEGGYDIAGSVIARAVRLEAKAPAGGLLVDDASYEGLTKTQKKRYVRNEPIKGKRDEVFDCHRCVLNPDGKADAAHFVARRQLQPPDLPQTLGMLREDRRTVLTLFRKLKSWQYDDLIFLLDIPIAQRPPQTLEAERCKAHILRWAEEEDVLEDLLFELRQLTS